MGMKKIFFSAYKLRGICSEAYTMAQGFPFEDYAQ